MYIHNQTHICIYTTGFYRVPKCLILLGVFSQLGTIVEDVWSRHTAVEVKPKPHNREAILLITKQYLRLLTPIQQYISTWRQHLLCIISFPYCTCSLRNIHTTSGNTVSEGLIHLPIRESKYKYIYTLPLSFSFSPCYIHTHTHI